MSAERKSEVSAEIMDESPRPVIQTERSVANKMNQKPKVDESVDGEAPDKELEDEEKKEERPSQAQNNTLFKTPKVGGEEAEDKGFEGPKESP